MVAYQYKARDSNGALVTGTLEANDVRSLENSLDRMGLIPIKVSTAKAVISKGRGLGEFFNKKVTNTDIVLFSRQLATLFGAGVPLTRALFTLEKQMSNPKFVAVITALREEVEEGSTFAAAVAKHSDIFPEIYSNMIEAGEAGGMLDEVLDRLAAIFEKSAENAAKVKSATLYPKIVITAIVLAVIVLMNFVVPRFAKMYASFDVALPLPTRILMALSNAFVSYWYIGVVIAIVVYLGLKSYLSTDNGKMVRDTVVLKLPIFGPLIQKSTLSRFARVLGSMYRSGLPILQSLDIVSRAVDNGMIKSEIKTIEADVREGKDISEPMAKCAHFDTMVIQMVAVGEETGNLDEMLDKVADYYDKEVDATIRNLTTILEPVLLAFIFGIVLFMALAIFLPMWDILRVVQQ
ncbi:MAG: type II secretion system F family protein [Proteobacteria bacterium]|nr:type II secretion system F family protein [Pseudomonadota bacterium]